MDAKLAVYIKKILSKIFMYKILWFDKHTPLSLNTAMSMFSCISKLLRTKQNYFILHNERKISFLNGRSLFRKDYSKTELRRIFIPIQIKIREIKLTNPEQELVLNPLYWLNQSSISPIVYFIEIISALLGLTVKKLGKGFRAKKRKIILEKLGIIRGIITTVGTFGTAFIYLYYHHHVVKTPLTGRKRLIVTSDKLCKQVGEAVENAVTVAYESAIVPTNHHYYRRSKKVIEKIISANQDLPEVRGKNWGLVIIEKPNELNAFCLPSGKVLIFSGLLKFCANDDQLAAVISHEISHVILGHYPEQWSMMIVLRFLLFWISFIYFIIFKFYQAFMLHLTSKCLFFILVNLPHSRTIEEEADAVSLLIAAKSCFDVREIPLFWRTVQLGTLTQGYLPEWLSTHPSNENRVENLNQIMPLALELRAKSNCSAFTDFLTIFHNKWRF